jgi:RNA polymerase sigma-70 factor, ECF subfamily
VSLDFTVDHPITPTETELIERVIAGDRAAFGEMYTRYLDAIYRYIFFRVGNQNDAEDLTEIVFLKAWQGVREFRYEQRDGLPFSCWLYKIAHHTLIDHLRKQKASPCDEELPCRDDELRLPQPIYSLNDVEDASALAQAISKLSEAEQQIILLRFIEGLSHAEVAAILEKSEGACRMLQSRALVALYRQLNGD